MAGTWLGGGGGGAVIFILFFFGLDAFQGGLITAPNILGLRKVACLVRIAQQNTNDPIASKVTSAGSIFEGWL